MKKIGLICAVALAGMSLTACGSQTSKKASSSSKASSSKVVKHHKKQNKKNTNNSSSSNQISKTQNKQQATAQSQSNSESQQLTQSEINRQRGYDPNGAPLLPGQDHAAGSNPDGSPDAWVQGQIDWAIQNGYMNPDGTNTPKGQAAEDEVERDSQPGMP